MAKKPTLREQLLAGPPLGRKQGPPSWLERLTAVDANEAAELVGILEDFIRRDKALRKQLGSEIGASHWAADVVNQLGVETSAGAIRAWMQSRGKELKRGTSS